MSRADLERLAADLRNEPGLAEEFSEQGYDTDAWVRLANIKGYHLTPAEAEGLCSSSAELSEDDLETMAGGWSSGSSTARGG